VRTRLIESWKEIGRRVTSVTRSSIPMTNRCRDFSQETQVYEPMLAARALTRPERLLLWALTHVVCLAVWVSEQDRSPRSSRAR
jgi:hypothetical protein